jgi:hypothetical protein
MQRAVLNHVPLHNSKYKQLRADPPPEVRRSVRSHPAHCFRSASVALTRLWPSASHVVQPETILRWHRAGFTAFWRWKSRRRAGRPKIGRELRDLIRRACEPIAFEVQEVMRFECHANATPARLNGGEQRCQGLV